MPSSAFWKLVPALLFGGAQSAALRHAVDAVQQAAGEVGAECVVSWIDGSAIHGQRPRPPK
jgi:hypothetical protein